MHQNTHPAVRLDAVEPQHLEMNKRADDRVSMRAALFCFILCACIVFVCVVVLYVLLYCFVPGYLGVGGSLGVNVMWGVGVMWSCFVCHAR